MYTDRYESFNEYNVLFPYLSVEEAKWDMGSNVLTHIYKFSQVVDARKTCVCIIFICINFTAKPNSRKIVKS